MNTLNEIATEESAMRSGRMEFSKEVEGFSFGFPTLSRIFFLIGVEFTLSNPIVIRKLEWTNGELNGHHFYN